MSKLLIQKSEMVLIKNSEAAKNTEIYGNLYATLQNHTILNRKSFQENPLFDDKSRVVILNNKDLLMSEIKQEWCAIGHSDIANGEVHCQLCGRKNIWVFYIKNNLNGIELNVGSECIKTFPGSEFITQTKRTFNEQKKQQDLIKRTLEFGEIDMTNLNYIKETEQWFEDFKILLPYELYNKIKDTLYNINFLKTSYIKKGGKITTVKEEYFKYKEFLECYKKEASHVYETNKYNPLICKKNLSDWLKIEKPGIWEHIMRNGGILDVDSLKHCYQPAFVHTKLNFFNSKIVEKDIQIVDVNGSSIRFVIQNSDYIYPLYFEVECKDFMEHIGCYCLTDKTYRFSKSDLTRTVIEQIGNNFNAICTRIQNPLEKIGLQIESSAYTNQKYYVLLPQTIKKSEWSRRIHTTEIGYKKLAETSLFSIFNKLIFASDTDIELAFSRILAQLNRSGKWMSKEEKEEQENISKSLYIQQQRTFTPYK